MRSDEAIVLGSQALGEADLIVTWIGRDGAKVRAVARSARRSRRRFGGALEPMSRVTVRWTAREGRELQRVDDVDLVRSYADMQADPAVQAACAVFAELSDALTREADDDARVFRLLEAVLDALAGGGDPLVMVRYFEYWMLRLHGLLPDVSTCSSCQQPIAFPEAWIAQRTIEVHCTACARASAAAHRRMTPAGAEFLEAVARSGPAELAVPRTAAGPESPVEILLRGAIEEFLERRLRTYRHLNAATQRG